MQIVKGLSFPIRYTTRGNLAVSQQNDKLQDNLKSIVTTSVGQRLMRPTYGVASEDLLFTKMETVSVDVVQANIAEAIALYEPRVNLISILVQPNYSEASFTIEIVFKPTALGFQPENTFTFDI